MPLRQACAIYGWRLLGFFFTFAPMSVLYVLALVIAQIGHHPAPKLMLTLVILTLLAVAGGCVALGAWIHHRVTRMPREVRFVLTPLIVFAIFIAAVVAIPLVIVDQIF
jgi:hypothetical protein